MSGQSPTLAEQAASLRASATADGAHGWVVNALHAMIMACLARLFARLEQMIQLWQAGLLPALPPRAISVPLGATALSDAPAFLRPRRTGGAGRSASSRRKSLPPIAVSAIAASRGAVVIAFAVRSARVVVHARRSVSLLPVVPSLFFDNPGAPRYCAYFISISK